MMLSRGVRDGIVIRQNVQCCSLEGALAKILLYLEQRKRIGLRNDR